MGQSAAGESRPSELGEPWASLKPRAVLYLRHRLHRYCNACIARHYGVDANCVRQQLKGLLHDLRRRSNLRLHDVADVLVLAAYDRLPPLPLPVAHCERPCCGLCQPGAGDVTQMVVDDGDF